MVHTAGTGAWHASHHHTHGQGMCGDHWEHLGPIPYAVRGVVFMEGVHTTPTRSPVTKLTSTQGRSHARSCHRLSTRHPHRHYRLHTASWRAQAPPATSTGRSSGMTVRSTARRSDRTATWATFSARRRGSSAQAFVLPTRFGWLGALRQIRGVPAAERVPAISSLPPPGFIMPPNSAAVGKLSQEEPHPARSHKKLRKG